MLLGIALSCCFLVAFFFSVFVITIHYLLPVLNFLNNKPGFKMLMLFVLKMLTGRTFLSIGECWLLIADLASIFQHSLLLEFSSFGIWLPFSLFFLTWNLIELIQSSVISANYRSFSAIPSDPMNVRLPLPFWGGKNICSERALALQHLTENLWALGDHRVTA